MQYIKYQKINKDTTTSLQISPKIFAIKKPNQIALLSTEYSEHLNLVQSWLISRSAETCSIAQFGFYNVFWREMVVSLSEQKCLFKIRSKIWKKESVFLFSLREGDWDRSSFLEIKSTNEDLWLKLLVADIDQTDFKIVLTTQKKQDAPRNPSPN